MVYGAAGSLADDFGRMFPSVDTPEQLKSTSNAGPGMKLGLRSEPVDAIWMSKISLRPPLVCYSTMQF